MIHFIKNARFRKLEFYLGQPLRNNFYLQTLNNIIWQQCNPIVYSNVRYNFSKSKNDATY